MGDLREQGITNSKRQRKRGCQDISLFTLANRRQLQTLEPSSSSAHTYIVDRGILYPGCSA